MSCIVLTTDFSEESTRPFAPVVALAKQLGLDIHLLHVVVDLKAIPHGAPLAPPQSSPDLSQELYEAQTKLDEFAKKLGNEVPVTSKVFAAEEVIEGICEYATEQKARYLALSSHGRSGIRHFILGSVAEAVVRQATVPAIIYPPAD